LNTGLFLSLTILGIVNGAMYALGAMGIVLVYKTTRVLNFAHGAIGMAATFVAYQFANLWHVNVMISVLIAVAFSVLLGGVVERFTIRPLEGRPPLVKVVVTLGWLLVLTSIVGIIWGASAYHLPVQLVPNGTVRFPGVSIDYAEIIDLVVAGLLTVGLASFFRRAQLGVAMRAVADDPSTARILGIKVDRVNAAAWAMGSGLAAIAGILLSQKGKVPLDTYSLTLVVIFSFAAALSGGLVSLPKAFAAAIALGVVQSVAPSLPGIKQLNIMGLADLLALGVILFALLRPRSALVRAVSREAPESAGARPARPASGRSPAARRAAVVAGIALAAVLPFALNEYGAYTLSQILVFAIALLGMTLITGLLGQPSLMHAELMGFGGFLAGALIAHSGIGFWVALPLSVAAGYLLGMLVGLPALRIRGLALAVVTLAIARVFDQFVFTLNWFSGGVGGRRVDRPSIPGLNLASDRVYFQVLLVAFVGVVMVVLSVRRGRIGRMFQSIRDAESGAAASGVAVTRAKLFGFSLASAIAALAGALGAGLDQTVTIQQYPWTKSLVLLAILTIMGSSSIQGTIYGAAFIVLSPQVLEGIPGLSFFLGKEDLRQLVPLISGGALVLQTILAPQGLVPTVGAALAGARARWPLGSLTHRGIANPADRGPQLEFELEAAAEGVS